MPLSDSCKGWVHLPFYLSISFPMTFVVLYALNIPLGLSRTSSILRWAQSQACTPPCFAVLISSSGMNGLVW